MTLPLLLLAGSVFAQSAPTRPHRVAGVFRSSAGAHWAGRSDWAGRYPAYVLVRRSADETPSLIVIESFPLGGKLYADAAEFLKSMKEGPRRERPVALDVRNVSGKRRTLWERSLEEPVRIGKSGRAPRRSVRERFILIERERDFLVVRLKAPHSEFEAGAKEFDAFLAAFELLPARRRDAGASGEDKK